MAPRMMEMTTFGLVLATVLLAGVSGQSDCTNVIVSMSPCLNYITGNSSTPSSNCCSQLASVVRSSPQCLCQVLNGGSSSLGININQTQALNLPGACKVQTPPLSSCNAASPADTPTATTSDSPNSTPSDGGSKSVPTSPDGTSEGSSIQFSSSLLCILLLVGTYASVFTA